MLRAATRGARAAAFAWKQQSVEVPSLGPGQAGWWWSGLCTRMTAAGDGVAANRSRVRSHFHRGIHRTVPSGLVLIRGNQTGALPRRPPQPPSRARTPRSRRVRRPPSMAARGGTSQRTQEPRCEPAARREHEGRARGGADAGRRPTASVGRAGSASYACIGRVRAFTKSSSCLVVQHS
jgi:hypothetical protein